jgi:hypothetical protein
VNSGRWPKGGGMEQTRARKAAEQQQAMALHARQQQREAQRRQREVDAMMSKDASRGAGAGAGGGFGGFGDALNRKACMGFTLGATNTSAIERDCFLFKSTPSVSASAFVSTKCNVGPPALIARK